MPTKRLCDVSSEELKSGIENLLLVIKDLDFKEFMANTYTEKGIIREDIDRIKDTIRIYLDIIIDRDKGII